MFEKIKLYFAKLRYLILQEDIEREVKNIQSNIGLSAQEIEQYNKIYKTCQSNGQAIDKDDVIIAIIKNTYDVPIVGIYWLDGWFTSMRFGQDRYASDLVKLNPRSANKIKHTRNIYEGDYIVVLESNARELKKEIKDLDGRILRDQINCSEYYALLIKITKDYRKENEQAYGNYLTKINQIANEKIGYYPLNRLNKDIVEKYQNICDRLLSKYPYDYDNTWVEGTVIDRRYIKTVEDVSYINFKQGKPKLVNIGDIAYMSSGCSFMPSKAVEVLEVRKNSFLVKQIHDGLIGEVNKLYDATGAYLTGYFQEHETSATLKWGQDHMPTKYNKE